MRKYFSYLFYVLEHKKNVFIECFRSGHYVHAFTHDLSKFRPSEFIQFAEYFYSKEKFQNKEEFNYAWNLHQKRNKHHWDYWVLGDGTPIPMPIKHINQMLCDWRAMGRKFGGSTKEFYEKNKHAFNMHKETIFLLDLIL